MCISRDIRDLEVPWIEPASVQVLRIVRQTEARNRQVTLIRDKLKEILRIIKHSPNK